MKNEVKMGIRDIIDEIRDAEWECFKYNNEAETIAYILGLETPQNW